MEEKNKAREELNAYRLEYSLSGKRLCTYEESEKYAKMMKNGGKLPQGIYHYNEIFSHLYFVKDKDGYEEKLTFSENEKYTQMYRKGEPLPEGIRLLVPDKFYVVLENDLSFEEKQEYLKYKELEELKTIRSCAVFFKTLTIIGLVISIVAVFISLMISASL